MRWPSRCSLGKSWQQVRGGVEAGVPTQEQLHGRAVAEMLRHALHHGFDATDIATGMQRAEVEVLHGTVTQVAQVLHVRATSRAVRCLMSMGSRTCAQVSTSRLARHCRKADCWLGGLMSPGWCHNTVDVLK